MAQPQFFVLLVFLNLIMSELVESETRKLIYMIGATVCLIAAIIFGVLQIFRA